MGPFDLIVFDLDGTLAILGVDIEAVRREVAALFLPHGIEGEFRPILDRIDAAALEVGGALGRELREQSLALITRAEVVASRTALPRAGAARALEVALQCASVAILTNNSRSAAKLVLDRLAPGHRFEIVGREDAPPKPAPDGLLLACNALGVRGRVLVIGDSVSDVRAARAAASSLDSVLVVAIRGGRGSDSELVQAQPDELIDELSELERLVSFDS